MKVLYLLRHAKSSWAEVSLADDQRPLSKRGQQAGRRMAAYVAQRRYVPDLVLCSPALRARQTLELVRPSLGKDAQMLFEEDLYAASSAELLQTLRRLPEATGSVLVVGHNPGLQDLAVDLAGRGAGRKRIQQKFPTAALAVLSIPAANWQELLPGSAELVDLVVPKQLG